MVLAGNFERIRAAYNFGHPYILYGCLKLAASEITGQYHTKHRNKMHVGINAVIKAVG